MCIIAVVVIWTIVDRIYKIRIANKDGEISLLTRQRDDYEDKLGGASPDQAKAKIDALEKREQREFVDRAFLGLGEVEIEWLMKMNVSGRPIGIPDNIWAILEHAGLVVRDFTGPKGIKDELKAAVSQRLAEQQSLANALEIIVSPASKYQSLEVFPNRKTGTVSIGVRNSHPERFITNCRCILKLPENVSAYSHSWLMGDGSFTLAAREEKLVPIAYHHVFVEKDPSRLDLIQLCVNLPGGSYLGNIAPDLPVGTQFITLEATSTETKPCSITCKVWVEEHGNLRLEKAY